MLGFRNGCTDSPSGGATSMGCSTGNDQNQYQQHDPLHQHHEHLRRPNIITQLNSNFPANGEYWHIDPFIIRSAFLAWDRSPSGQ